MKYMKRRGLFFLLLTIVMGMGFVSCSKTSRQKARELEVELRDKYIAKYYPDAQPTSDGLYVIKEQDAPAGADTVAVGDVVKVFYTGNLIEETDSTGVQDGYVFDSSGNYEPFTFTVGAGSVVTGWEEAILQMKEGEKAVWIIPSTLGYSGTPQSGVPAYSTLVFHVTVYKVIKSSSSPVIIERKF